MRAPRAWACAGLLALGLASFTAPGRAIAADSMDARQPSIASATLTVQRRGTGRGRVISADRRIDCGTDCSETSSAAVVVDLIAVPAADASFAGWVGDADCADGQVTLAADRACIARFEALADARPLDLDGDGRGDLIGYAARAPAGGASPFAAQRAFAGVMRAGDFNGDRRSDVFTYDPVTGAWSIEIGPVAGMIGTAPPRRSPLVIDINGDGLADVVFHDPVTGEVQPCVPTLITLACGPATTAPTAAALIPVELNGDGRADLLAYRWNTGEGTFLIGEADGQFRRSLQTLVAAAESEVVPIDVNGDSESELIVYDAASGAATLYVNGSLGFVPLNLGSVAGFTLRAARLDGDARDDLIAYNATTGQTLQVLNTGGGFSVTSSVLPAGRQLVVTDLDGDRRSDVVLYDPATGAMTLAVSRADGTFAPRDAPAAAGLTILGGRR